MAFYDDWEAKVAGTGSKLQGAILKLVGLTLAKADGSLDLWRSNGAGAALVSIVEAVLPTGAATAAAQAVLAALVATPGTPSAITKSNDTVTTTITAKGILVGGAGNLVVKPAAGGDDVTLVVVAGQYVPLQCSRVMVATTATGLVGLS